MSGIDSLKPVFCVAFIEDGGPLGVVVFGVGFWLFCVSSLLCKTGVVSLYSIFIASKSWVCLYAYVSMLYLYSWTTVRKHYRRSIFNPEPPLNNSYLNPFVQSCQKRICWKSAVYRKGAYK